MKRVLLLLIPVLAACSPSSSTTPSTPPPPAGPAPVVFNASASARPGDLVYLQGENFGPAPEVWLDRPAMKLPLQNSVGTGWVAVRIPADAIGALTVHVRNGAATSAPVFLNRARPLHLDAEMISPGGGFRIFGRNLVLPGSTPVVKVENREAAVKISESDEHMIVAVAPAGINVAGPLTITVDNGNGSGPATLDRFIRACGGSGDPYGLGVGWTGGFTEVAEKVVPVKVAADGTADDSDAINEAIEKASAARGGTLQLPEGTIRITKTLSLKNNIVLQGAGKDKTVLRYEKSNYPVWASGFAWIGLRNLTLRNGGKDIEGPLIKGNNGVVLQNVKFDVQVSQQMYLSENRNIVITGCDFIQGGSLKGQGPYVITNSTGLVFTHNVTLWKDGAPSFQESHDSYIAHNTWTRDASTQNTPIITTHCCVIDFCHRVAVVGNTFDVINGPITNRDRNDGETLLTEGGGGHRTENLGAVDSATADSITDPANILNVHPFTPNEIPENYGVAIVDGKGAGQTRRLVAYTDKTIKVERPWDVVPDKSSRYATFVWGLEKSILKGNTLKGNPRGIWLYQCSIRDVDVVGNSLLEGGGIYLRTWQSVGEKQFTPHFNVRIAGNKVANTTGIWASHIGSVYVIKEPRPFGLGQVGIEVRDNDLTANAKNLQLNAEDYANIEGFYALMKAETNGKYQAPALPPFLGMIYERNRVTNCDVPFRIGTGCAGTIFSGNQMVNCKAEVVEVPAAPGQATSGKTVTR